MTAGTPHDSGTAAERGTAGPDATQPTGFGAVLRYFLRLGTSGFGGPIAVVGYMQRDLVQQRGWIARQPRRIDYYDDPSAPKANSLVPSVDVVVTNAEGEVLLIRS